MKFISIPIFLTSLALGLFVAYISSSPSQVVYVYPNPENQRKISFQDNAENCFHFQSKKFITKHITVKNHVSKKSFQRTV